MREFVKTRVRRKDVVDVGRVKVVQQEVAQGGDLQLCVLQGVFLLAVRALCALCGPGHAQWRRATGKASSRRMKERRGNEGNARKRQCRTKGRPKKVKKLQHHTPITQSERSQTSNIKHQPSTINHQSSIIKHTIIRHQTSDINHQSSNIKHQSSNIKHQTSIINHQSSNIKHQTSNINHQTSNNERDPQDQNVL